MKTIKRKDDKRPRSRVGLALVWLGVLALALGGCAALDKAGQRVEKVAADADAVRTKNIEQAGTAAVLRTKRPRLAGEEVAIRPVDTLPAVLLRKMTYSTSGGQTLDEALRSVGQVLGLSIRAGEITQSQSPQNNAPGGAPAPTPIGALTGKVNIEHVDRSAKELLDEIAAQNDASWRYLADSQTVEFFRWESRTISVYLPPGAKTISASISLASVAGSGSGGGTSGAGASGGAAPGGGGGGSSGGSGGAGNVSVAQELRVDPWSSIMAGITAILSEGESVQSGKAVGTAMAPAGGAGANAALSASGKSGRASASPELGFISVTARPEAVARIAQYISSVNARFAQNVLVDIKIFSVNMQNQASAGFSVDALYQKLGNYGVSVVGATPLQPSTGTPGQLTITSTGPDSRWNSSNVVAQALSQFGTVTLETQGQVIAVNGQPSPIQVADEINYLASSATTQTANVGTTSTLTPGTRVVGFTANFLPLILGDNRILLQYQLQISQMTSLGQVTSAGNSIQTPQISSQSLQQQAFVRDGQSIVLFGFNQNRDTSNHSMGLGGASRTGEGSRQMVVIVLQVNGGRKDV